MKPSDLPAGADLRAIANRCVACGLCVPHCPTYRKTLSEADSPRGRIALMDGVLAGRIPANERFFRHLDLCLGCRACERVCPNQVPYGRLADEARESTAPLREGMHGGALRKLALDQVVAKPWRLAVLAPLFSRYAGSGLQRLVRASGMLRIAGLAELEAQLPSPLTPAPRPGIYPAQGAARGAVGLFLGCAARILDGEALSAAVLVLNRLGYTVHVPARQSCCGGLHREAGRAAAAHELAAQNIAAFSEKGLGAIVSVASGCGARLAEYGGNAAAEEFSARVCDISAFLADAGGWDTLVVAPLAAGILVHEPCTLRNALRAEAAPYRLLKRIPQAVVEPLEGNDQCCGAAGSYFLREPEMARLLLDDKIRAARSMGAKYLATSNIGCARFLADGLRSAGVDVEVVHPVTLVARQLPPR